MATSETVTEEQVVEALRKVYDPEIPVSIYDLGLIYEILLEPSGEVNVRMTLTAPNCPVAHTLPEEARRAVQAVPGVTEAKVEVVFDPPWSPSRMSEAAKLELGMGLIEL